MDPNKAPCERLLTSLINKNVSVELTMHNGAGFSGKLLYIDDSNIVLGSPSSYIISKEDPVFNVTMLVKTEIASLRFSVGEVTLKEHLGPTIKNEEE